MTRREDYHSFAGAVVTVVYMYIFSLLFVVGGAGVLPLFLKDCCILFSPRLSLPPFSFHLLLISLSSHGEVSIYLQTDRKVGRSQPKVRQTSPSFLFSASSVHPSFSSLALIRLHALSHAQNIKVSTSIAS
jgi:hypothetical protein